MVGKTERTMGTNGEGTTFRKVITCVSSARKRLAESLHLSTPHCFFKKDIQRSLNRFSTPRCSLWWIYTGYPKSLVNSLVSLLEREILIWLLLSETFESLWMGSLQLTTPTESGSLVNEKIWSDGSPLRTCTDFLAKAKRRVHLLRKT